jgi:transposase
MINSTFEDVSRKQDIECKTLQLIIDRYVDTDVDFSAIKYLGLLGIDEISLRKGRQKYVTVFTYRHNGKVLVLKIIDGRKMEDVEAFLKSIPEKLKQTVTTVCSDLYDGYINAAKAVFGNTRITADRFHVSKLYRKKLIIIRKSELKRLKKILTEEEYKDLKSATSILRKEKDYFTEDERKVLDPLFELSPKLHLAYTFSHQLTTIFNSKIKKNKATSLIESWIENVNNSKLNVFNSFIETLNKHMNEISNYFKERNSSGFVEGFNNRIKVLTRRCYGLGNAKRLFQRIKLDTEGLKLFKFSGAYC